MSSRAQPLQPVCSIRVTRCLGAPVPATGCHLALTNTMTFLVTESDIEQCCRMSLGGSKLVPPQRFSEVLSNAFANVVHAAQHALCAIKALRCSQPIKRNRLGDILRKSSCTAIMQQAERELAVSAAPPRALTRQLQRSRFASLTSMAVQVAPCHHPPGSGGSPSARPPPPTQNLSPHPWQRLLCPK